MHHQNSAEYECRCCIMPAKRRLGTNYQLKSIEKNFGILHTFFEKKKVQHESHKEANYQTSFQFLCKYSNIMEIKQNIYLGIKPPKPMWLLVLREKHNLALAKEVNIFWACLTYRQNWSIDIKRKKKKLFSHAYSNI